MKKKFGKIICTLAIATFLSSNMVIAMETIKLPQDFNEKVMEEIKVHVNDKDYKVENVTKRLETAPYIKNGCFMIPVNFISEIAGLPQNAMLWDDENKTLIIFKDHQIIQATVDSNVLNVDGDKIELDTVAEIKDGYMMLPLKSIAKVLGIEAKWNDEKKNASIFIEKQLKNQVDTWDYTYEDLLNKALKSSRDLKTANMNVERTEIIKDDANDDSHCIPLSYGVGPAELPANAAYLKMSKADFEYQLSEKMAGKIKEKIAYDVKNAYYEVLKSEDHKKIAKMAVDLTKDKARLISLNYKEGLASEIENRQAKRAYEEAKKQYNLAEKEVEKAYEKLNDLAGLDVTARYVLKNELVFKDEMDENVDGHIAKVIGKSPDIWALKKITDLKELNVKLHVFNLDMTTKWSFGIDPYDAKEIDAKMAELKLGSVKQQYDQSLRELHTTLNQIEDQYEKDKISYEKAKDDLKMARLNVEVGNELPITIKKAELQLENTKKELREKIMTYNTAAMIYEKPWIITQKEDDKEEK